MKISNIFKKKLFKPLLSILAISSVSIITANLIINSQTHNNTKIISNTNNSNNKSIDFLLNNNFQLISNPIINLDQKYNNLFINLLGNNLEQNNEFLTSIKNTLKLSNYWVDNNAPATNTLDFKIKTIIKAYKNPLLNFLTPAISVEPIITQSDGQIKKLSPTIVSIIGTKLGYGSTYALDTINNQFENNTNKNASFIYLPQQLSSNQNIEILSNIQLKDYLFNNPSLMNSLFANLPTISNTNTSVNTNGQFTLAKDSLDISLGYENGVDGKYTIYSYPVTLKMQFLEENTVSLPSLLPNQFNINVYYPTSLIKQNQLLPEESITYISNILLANNDQTLSNLSPYEFDQLRLNNINDFKTKIINLLKSSSINLPENFSTSDININVNSSKWIYDDLGISSYDVIIKKVKLNNNQINTDEANWIKTKIIIGGLLKTYETKYTNTYSINGINELTNCFASSFAKNNSISNNVLTTLASSTSSISLQNPSFVYNGSLNLTSTNNVAKMFGAKEIIDINFNNAIYDDNYGIIKNIIVTLKGFYDESGIYNIIDNKKIIINLVGFKTFAVNGITYINNIILDSVYNKYPAQSFLFNQTERMQKLQAGELPTIDSGQLSAISGNEIKELIKNNAVNLPQESIDQYNSWQLRNLSLNNFEGTITGEVYFPSYYDNGNNNDFIIVKNAPNTDLQSKWFKFSINGFSTINGPTTISPFETDQIVYENEYGVLEQRNASSITLDEFNTLCQKDTNLLYKTISYWIVDKFNIVSNRWDTFNEQIKNSIVGISDIKSSLDKSNNSFIIEFNFYYFNESGKYVNTAKLSPCRVAKIVINNFKNPSGNKIISTINENSIIPINLFNEPYNQLDTRQFVQQMSSEISSSSQPTPLLDNLTKLINQYCVSNINNNKLPSYQFSVSPLNNATDVPFDPLVPGSIFFYAKFKNNYFNNQGQFVDNNIAQDPFVKIEINNFNLMNDTAIPSIITAPENVVLENGQPILASQAAISTNVQKINAIKQLIVTSIYNPKDDPTKEGYIDTSTIPNYNVNINNEQYVDGIKLANNGVSYFGDVNDFLGTITIYIKFNANKWYKDFTLQTQDSEPIVVTISGFKPLNIGDHYKNWYNPNITLDTNGLTADVGNDFNELASNLCGNVNSLIINKTINRIKSSGLVNKEFSSNPNSIYYIDVDNLEITMDTNKNQANNENGSLICNLSTYGNNIFDPKTGLYYRDINHPFKFDVYINGFNKAKKTIYNKQIFLINQSKNTATDDVNLIKNNLFKKENLNNLFNNTLPSGFNRTNDSLEWNVKNYIYLPDSTRASQSSNRKDNIEIDYENGTITIKELALLNYIDNNYQLVFNPHFTMTSQTTWADVEKNNPLILTNVVFEGYQKMAPTTINSDVEMSKYKNLLPSEFIKEISKKPIFGTDTTSSIELKLAKELIYNPLTNDLGQINPNPVNNLPLFFKNYNTNYTSYPPVFEIVPNSIKPNNIKGTITFDLKLTNNFFYISNNKLLFKNLNDPTNVNPIIKNVAIHGFNTIHETTINSKVNLNNLTNAADNELLKNRWDLFWYCIPDATNSQTPTFNDSKQKLINLIKDNIIQFINYPYGFATNPNINEYLEIPYFDLNNVNFANGTITFDIKLFKFVAKDGTINDGLISDPNAPFITKTIEIYGFNPSNVTSSNTINDLVEINIKDYFYLNSLDFYTNQETLNAAVLQSPIYANGQAEIIVNNFRNIPPNTIFKFKETDHQTNITSLKDVQLTLDPVTPTNINNGDAFRTGTITLNNILVKAADGQIHLGSNTFRLKLTGFGNRINTQLKTNIWDLSINFNDLALAFDNTNISNQSILDFLNQKISYNGNNVSLFSAFMINPIIEGNNQTEIRIDSFTNIANEGNIDIDLSYRNYYDNNGQLQTNWISKPIKVTIKGFRIHIATSPITNQPISSVIPINILPSDLLSNLNNEKQTLIDILNKPGNLDSLFQNYKNNYGVGKEFSISDLQVIRVDDSSGTIKVKLTCINTIGNDGLLNPNPTTFENIFDIIHLNFIRPTEINATQLSLQEYFKNKTFPTNPNNIETLTPSQYIEYINAELNKGYSEGKNESQMLELFNSIIIQIINPLYCQDSVINNFESYTQALNTNWFASNILSPGCEYAIDQNGNYNIVPSKTQDISSLWTAIDFNSKINDAGEKEFNIYNIFTTDDRLGTLSFNFNVKGLWKFELDKNNNYIIKKTEGNYVPNLEKTKITITLSGFAKDVQTQELLSTIIISSSVVGGVLLLVIVLLIIFLMIKRFNLGN